MNIVDFLFNTNGFPPRWYCGTGWTPALGWTHIISDVLIFISYTSIPVSLLYFIQRRKDIPFFTIFILFGAFILFCGFGHLIEAYIFWEPIYRFSGLIKLCTAIVSLITAGALIYLMPKILNLPAYAAVRSYLASVLESSDDIIFAFNRRGELTSFNKSAERILKIQNSDAGKRLDKLAPALFPGNNKFAKFLNELSQNQTIPSYECTLTDSDKTHEFMVTVSPIFSMNKLSYLGGSLIIKDITERKKADLRSNEEAARMKAVMNTVIDGLITIDERGLIQSFNPSSVRIFGYQPEEVIGKNIKMLMPEPYHSGHDSYLKNYMNTNEAKVIGIGREVSAKRKDGKIFPIELGVNEMQVMGQRMFVGTIRDISERKKAEHEIQNYLNALKRSNQELDDFAYIASHDLKEPLRGLSNNALFLKEDYQDKIDENGIKRINRITFLCNRMEHLVNDLLYFSRIGKQELAIQPTNLNEIICDITAMMETSIQEANAEIKIEKELPTIICDRTRITEVFRNLITNAIKYNTKANKSVNIGFEEQNHQPVFFVRDNGIGIAPEFYHDVFRIFKRLNEEDDAVKGTGVGLTFVKKIIERHNGDIWIESIINEGTTFYFTIPEAQKE